MELRDDDVLTVLHTLEYDRLVDCGPGLGEDDEDVFRETKLPVPERHAATSLPCGVCPVRTLSPQELFSGPTHLWQRLNPLLSTACPVRTHAATPVGASQDAESLCLCPRPLPTQLTRSQERALKSMPSVMSLLVAWLHRPHGHGRCCAAVCTCLSSVACK